MTTASISLYKTIKDVSGTDTITIDKLLDRIKDGYWQDAVLKIRTLTDKKQRQVAKEKLPNVTLSGIFGKRQDDQIKSHSGYIGIDLDDLGSEVEPTRDLLTGDPYIYSVFTSVSGTGLCLIFRIDPLRHKDAFEAIADYLVRKYGLLVDPTGINPSRARYVSYDPDLSINDNAAVYKKYLPKPKQRKIPPPIFVQTEFDDIIRQMVDRQVNCVEDYRDWRDVGFALGDRFGESGRDYFHRLSAISSKYDTAMCDRQYNHSIARNARTGARVTIATIYWFASQEGIQTSSERTRKIAAATSALKSSGMDSVQISETLQQHEGIQDADDIIKQAFAVNYDYSQTNTLVDNVRMWVRQRYAISRNAITRKVEIGGKEIDDEMLNTMFLDCKVVFDDVTSLLFEKVIFSRNTPTYNPFEVFLSSHQWDGKYRIADLARSIKSETGDAEWRERMIMKWLVGIIHSMKGGVNELNFILVGGKNTGKTQFFRRLLPKELRYYFAASQLNRGKDDEALMCQKLIIFNDEYGGKNKVDERNEKRLMAADQFDLREPYGKANVTLLRLASLCGTCNEDDVLDDPTGNRRIIVIKAAGRFDYDLYNSIDKIQLLMEAHELWKQGELPDLNQCDIELLEAATEKEHSKVSFEEEMIQQYFLEPGKSDGFMTTTEIKLHLEIHTRDKININKVGARLRKLGYLRKAKGDIYGYNISKIPTIFSPAGDIILPF